MRPQLDHTARGQFQPRLMLQKHSVGASLAKWCSFSAVNRLAGLIFDVVFLPSLFVDTSWVEVRELRGREKRALLKFYVTHSTF